MHSGHCAIRFVLCGLIALGGCSTSRSKHAAPGQVATHPADPLAHGSPPVKDVAVDRLSVRGENAVVSAKLLSQEIEGEFVRLGLPKERAKAVASDAEIILRSTFKPDFNEYHRLMLSKGLALDGYADGFSSNMKEDNIYPSAPAQLWGQGRTGKVRYMWEHPSERRAEWESVEFGTVECGHGLTIVLDSLDWPFKGVANQMSLYAPKGGRLTHERGEELASNPNGDAVWFSVEGNTTDGTRFRMRMFFIYDYKTAQWLPLQVSYGHDGSKPPPFPLI